MIGFFLLSDCFGSCSSFYFSFAQTYYMQNYIDSAITGDLDNEYLLTFF